MAYTQTDVDNARRAYARGVRKLKMSNGEEVEFNSPEALLRQIKVMEAEIAGGAAGSMSVTYPTTARGL